MATTTTRILVLDEEAGAEGRICKVTQIGEYRPEYSVYVKGKRVDGGFSDLPVDPYVKWLTEERGYTEQVGRIYELVTNGATFYMTREEIARHFRVTGHSGEWPLAKLAYQPKIDGFCGPMNGGGHLVRYETQEVYNHLSGGFLD